jgi:hypothetical protein
MGHGGTVIFWQSFRGCELTWPIHAPFDGAS